MSDLHGDPAGYVAAAGGVVTDAVRYDPYGEVSASVSSGLPSPWGYQGRLQPLVLVAVACPGLRGQRPLAVDQEVPEPVPDLDEVLGAAERRARACQLVGFADHPHEPDRASMAAQDGEEGLGLADRRAEVLLGMLDQEGVRMFAA